MLEFSPFAAAIAGGVFPALAWLWFWLREDSHPEPRRLIGLAFIAGMLTVGIVIPIQKFVAPYLPTTTLVFAAWSTIEEIAKFFAAAVTVLWRREDDEPIDPVIYMVAVALGFAALENSLFLLSPVAGEGFVQTVLTGNLRFVGATLLHVLSSAVVGLCIAYAFYRRRLTRWSFAILGVILASVLHTAFNFFILNAAQEHLMKTFASVWVGVIIVLAALEFVKRIKPRPKRA